MNNRETLQTNNQRIENNNLSLETILETISNLPEAGETMPVNSIEEAIEKMTDRMFELTQALYNLPNTYEVDTTEPVTLYNPAVSTQYYVIRKNTENKYNVVWIAGAPGGYPVCLYQNAESTFNFPTFSVNTSSSYWPGQTRENTPNVNMSFGSNENRNCWVSPSYETLQECIDAVQSSATTYTSGRYASFTSQFEDGYMVPYTNLPCVTTDYKFGLSRRISSNEIFNRQ